MSGWHAFRRLDVEILHPSCFLLAPPSLPAVVLLLRSWLQRGSKILPHLFLGNRLTVSEMN